MRGAQDTALRMETPKELTIEGAWTIEKSDNEPSSSAYLSNASWCSNSASRGSGVAIPIGFGGQEKDIVSQQETEAIAKNKTNQIRIFRAATSLVCVRLFAPNKRFSAPLIQPINQCAQSSAIVSTSLVHLFDALSFLVQPEGVVLTTPIFNFCYCHRIFRVLFLVHSQVELPPDFSPLPCPSIACSVIFTCVSKQASVNPFLPAR